jgi:hypothetical protein
VPAATSAVVSTITICNQSASNASYSLALMAPSEFSATAPTATYIIRGGVVPAADTIAISIGLTGNAGSVLVANTNSSSISFGAFGSEIS